MMRRMFRREGWVPGAVELTDLALLAKVAHTRRRARWVGECDDAVGVFFVLKGATPASQPSTGRRNRSEEDHGPLYGLHDAYYFEGRNSRPDVFVKAQAPR